MKKVLLSAIALAAAFAVNHAQATLYTFDLNHNFGTVDAGGNVLVNITEAATAGDVHISITNLTHGFLNEIYFNYSPKTDISNSIVYNFAATNGVVGGPAVQYNGTQGFALVFDFPNQPGPNFIYGESIGFDLSADADLKVKRFNVRGDTPMGSDYYVVAHINSVSENGGCADGSAKLGDVDGANISGGALSYECNSATRNAVPEPASALLLGSGLLGFAFRRRKAA